MKTDAVTGFAVPVLPESTAINSWSWVLDLPGYERLLPPRQEEPDLYDGYEPLYR